VWITHQFFFHCEFLQVCVIEGKEMRQLDYGKNKCWWNRGWSKGIWCARFRLEVNVYKCKGKLSERNIFERYLMKLKHALIMGKMICVTGKIVGERTLGEHVSDYKHALNFFLPRFRLECCLCLISYSKIWRRQRKMDLCDLLVSFKG
jgi:hypothetical protein